jgi:hypothetical protein
MKKKQKKEELQMPTLGDIYTVPLNMYVFRKETSDTTSVLYNCFAFIIT